MGDFNVVEKRGEAVACEYGDKGSSWERQDVHARHRRSKRFRFSCCETFYNGMNITVYAFFFSK